MLLQELLVTSSTWEACQNENILLQQNLFTFSKKLFVIQPSNFKIKNQNALIDSDHWSIVITDR